MALAPPQFDDEFRRQLRELFAWRGDVRRSRSDPIDPATIEDILDVACLAPSVGNSQPWRFVAVDDLSRRARVSETFRRCNRAALEDYSGARAALYAQLKLAGLAEAPFHLAVFVDEETTAGHGLGRRTMRETLHYSAVTALYAFWISARGYELGVCWGWVLG